MIVTIVKKIYVCGAWRPALIKPGRKLLSVVHRVDSKPGVRVTKVPLRCLDKVVELAPFKGKPYPTNRFVKALTAEGRKYGVTAEAKAILGGV